MRLSPIKLNTHLNDMGREFLWRRGYVCPCINPQSGQARTDCPECGGIGRFWSVGVKGNAAAISRNAIKKLADFGMWDAGDCILSIPSDSPLYDIGIYDRVTDLSKSEPFSINFTYGVNDVLRFVPIQIDRVSWFSGGVLVDGDIPVINEDGSLSWGVVSPPAKVTYSLTGRRIPEYFAFLDLSMDRPHHYGADLPRKVQMRRFDLFGR